MITTDTQNSELQAQSERDERSEFGVVVVTVKFIFQGGGLELMGFQLRISSVGCR